MMSIALKKIKIIGLDNTGQILTKHTKQEDNPCIY